MSMVVPESVGWKQMESMGLTMSGCWFGTFLIFPYIGNVIIPIDSYVSEG